MNVSATSYPRRAEILTLLSKDRRPDAFSWRFITSRYDSMNGTPVVPHGHRTDRPFPTNGMVVGGVDVVLEEIQQLV